MACLTAGLLGMQNASNRKIQKIKVTIVLFYLSISGLIVGAIYFTFDYLINGTPMKVFSYDTYIILFFICIFDSLQIAFNTKAFQTANASFVAMFLYLGVVYLFAADILIF